MMSETNFAPLEDWLFSYLSHEFRTPLSAMLGFSQMLRNEAYGDLNDQQKDRLDRVVRSAELLLRRLDLLLDYHRLYEDELDLSGETVLLPDVLQSALAATDYDSRGRELKIEVSNSLPHVELAVSRPWLGVALREVILHAASEAVPDPTVWIAATQHPAEAMIYVKVRYNAPPMDVWQQGNLFTVRNRTGIGLPLAMELLARMNGGIEYDSVATRHEIILRLPLAR